MRKARHRRTRHKSANLPVRVVIAGQTAPLVGGIATFVRGLVEHLDQGVVSASVLPLLPPPSRRLGTPSLLNIRVSLQHVRAVRRAARTAHLVHLNFGCVPLWPLCRATACARAARAAGSHVILHAHTGQLHRQMRRRLYRPVFRLATRYVAAFAVCSSEDERAVMPLAQQVVKITNGVDLDTWRPSAKPDPPMLLYLGTVAPSKGVLDLCAALSLLKAKLGHLPYRVVIAGDSRQVGTQVYNEIRREFGEARLDEVEFFGPATRGDAAKLMRDAAVFCLPSKSEGAPFAVLEAMAAEAAVVATRVGEVPEMLAYGEAGILIEKDDASALADALIHLANHADQRRAIARRGRARVLQNYTVATTAAEVLRLYLDVACA